MPGGINPSVSPINTFAAHMRQVYQRLASLERASGGSGGGGGGGSGGSNPAGTIIQGVWPTAPTGYAFLSGQTITNAQADYPELWAATPAAWHSGANLVLPNMDSAERVLSSGAAGVIGNVAGANTATIAAANLPAHTHTIDHDHGSIASGANSVGHTHSIAHDHPAATSAGANVSHTHTMDHNHATFNTASAGTHTHLARFLTTATGSGSNADLARPGTSTFTFTQAINAGGTADGAHVHAIDMPTSSGLVTGGHSANHTHTVDFASYAGNSGGVSANHTHTVDMPHFAGASGSVGSGTALNTQTARLYVRHAIKL